MNRHPRTKWLWGAITVALLAACGPKTPEPVTTESLARVRATEIANGPAVTAVEVAAVSAYRDEAKLSFKVGGVIDKVVAREGETVKKGQLLARLNQRDVRSSMAQAQASYDKALRDLKRGQQLRQQEVITQVQLDDLETALEVAQAQLNQAKFALDTATIYAPNDGVVLRRFAQDAEIVGAGQPVLLVASEASGFVAKASLSDSEAVKLSINNPATIQFDAHPGLVWQGKVIELSQAADPTTGTYGVQVSIDTKANTNAKLLSGLSGQLKVQPNAYNQQRQYLPLSAVVEGDNKQAWVFLLNSQNQVQRTQVQIAFVTKESVALVTPLPERSKVITTGAPYLRDGQTVEIVE